MRCPVEALSWQLETDTKEAKAIGEGLSLYLWECGNPHKERKGSGQKAANASF